MESLETRELLSINPLGIDHNINPYSAPDFVQINTTAQNFNTENVGNTINITANAQADKAVLAAAAQLVTPLAATYSGTAVTNSIATTNGVTTNQVTLTWGKPTKYTVSSDPNDGWKTALPKGATYNINIFDGNDAFIKTVNAGTKTTYTLTGLDAGQDYKFEIAANLTLTNPSDKTASAVTKTDAVVSAGEFKTQAAGDAADVTVGPPTDIKASYVKASGAKPAGVKVTWKAPANYTGGYVVTLFDGTNTITRTIDPGSKLEITQKIGDTFNAGTGDFSDAILVKDTRIKIVVTTTATHKIESTPTYVNTGTVPAAAAVVPAAPSAPTTAALANTPGGTTLTITTTDPNTVGYYVGFTKAAGAPAKSSVVFANLIYVPKAAAGNTTVDLKAASDDYIYAFAVGADGTISDTGSISAAVAVITADVTATDAANVYPAAKDVKGVTATADSSVKNKYTVKWTAATDHFSGTSTAAAPTAAADFKYVVTGYRVTATINNAVNTGASEVKYVAVGTNEVLFTDLRWNTKYDFKVEALVSYTTAQDATNWNAAATPQVSVGAAKAGVTVVKAPSVTDSVTIAKKTGTGVAEGTITISGTTVNTNYIITVTDANKAVLGTKTITATGTSEEVVLGGSSGLIGAELTPKAKYTVTVKTIGSVPGAVSKGKSVTINAADFVSATLKDAKGTTINSVKVEVVAPKSGVATGTHYMEYTNVVDAKGKADWNAAKVYTGTGTDPAAVTGTVEITQLNPNSQYFFRVVTVDSAWASGTNEWDKMTKVSTSKELKVKTATVPLPTITKPGFTLDGTDLALDFTGKSMLQVDSGATKKALTGLTGTPTYQYKLIVSQDSKVDKATGQLLSSQKLDVTITDAVVAGTDNKYKADNLQVTPVKFTGTDGIFDKLGLTPANVSSLKNINFQLEVTVNYGTSETFTVYSKVGKVTSPKWFV
ncbi:MAG: fibronectin type III domain-containing protein [Planctomycetaceae bacterium]|jgi:hypothetical protein|nr:fibronectin type III domain-containing protein [Planctomycetaceae bacterium]